jgi:uncharacterized membrane protein
MDQAIWNTSRGSFVEATENDIQSTRLTDHVEPIFILISPIFWIWDDVRALLLLQVVAVAIGAFPLYALALEKLNQLLSPADRSRIWLRDPVEQLTRPLALALAVAYLLAPQLQAAVLTEFHAIPLAVPLILWAFWAVEFHRWGQFAVAALLVTSVKEEAALLGAGLGVWALWRIAVGRWLLAVRRQKTKDEGRKTNVDQHPRPNTQYPISSPRSPIPDPRSPVPDPRSPVPGPQSLILAASVTILSLLWFYLATFVIVPSYAADFYNVAESSYFRRYGALGDSPLDIFKSFFTQPGVVWQIATEAARVDYVWGLLAIFGFLSLLAPEILLLCLPLLLANQLSAYPAQYYGEFHYSAPLIPYFGVAAAYGLGRLWRTLARRVNRRSTAFQHLPAAPAPTMALISLFTNAQTALRPLLAWGVVLWLLIWAGWHHRTSSLIGSLHCADPQGCGGWSIRGQRHGGSPSSSQPPPHPLPIPLGDRTGGEGRLGAARCDHQHRHGPGRSQSHCRSHVGPRLGHRRRRRWLSAAAPGSGREGDPRGVLQLCAGIGDWGPGTRDWGADSQFAIRNSQFGIVRPPHLPRCGTRRLAALAANQGDDDLARGGGLHAGQRAPLVGVAHAGR